MNLRTYKLLKSTAYLLCTVIVPSVYALDSAKIAQAKYDAIRAKVQSGDLNVDWQELRLDAVVAGVGSGFDWRKANAEGVAAFNAGDYKKALLKGEEITGHNIANGDGHFLSMVSLKHLAKQDEANQEKLIVDKIVQSITSSGDGRTASTAWFTVTTSEEYFIIRLLGMRPKSQALTMEGGHSFDQMTVVDENGKETTLWFNTDTDIEMTKRALGEK